MAQKNRITAAAISLFGGMVGAHKLYLGDMGGFTTFFFLLIFSINVFSMPLTFILGVFDAFKLLSMTDEQFNAKYNKGIVRPRNPVVDRRREEQMRRYENENVKRGYEQPVQRRETVRSNPFKKSGLAKYKDFDLEGAIDDFKQGLDISPNDIALHFNLACAYSLTEKKDLSYKHISTAVSLGFNDFERIMTHDDLAFIRIQSDFDAFKNSGFRTTNSAGAASSSSNPSQEKQQQKPQDDVLLSQLSRLAELRKRGILSEEEFNIEKRKLMR